MICGSSGCGSILRRSRPICTSIVRSKGPAARRLTGPDGQEVPLTAGEYELLLTLARHPGRVLSRDFLLEATRGRAAGPFDRTIDVQIGRLRRKIEPQPDEPQIIKSVRGAGYLFVPAVEPV